MKANEEKQDVKLVENIKMPLSKQKKKGKRNQQHQHHAQPSEGPGMLAAGNISSLPPLQPLTKVSVQV